MEGSSMNSMSKANISANGKTMEDDVSAEESGWTMYFEDFFNHDHHQNSYYNNEINGSDVFNSGLDKSSSFISDAASPMLPNRKKIAAGNNNYYEEEQMVKAGGSLNKNGSRIIPRKRKNKTGVAVVNDLEDTASSPVNSPKMYDMMKHFERRPKQKDHFMDISQVKGSTSADAGSNMERNTGGLVSSMEGDTDISELKKKGLCLVPLSTIINYSG